ncbi:MAG: Gfo/Idh/MocA family oxidoreductase, partial [Actinobacteria bacterium]|nr:Gfo/Idh/MocA family oxidoreductase [Actinomycetota bacterium]
MNKEKINIAIVGLGNVTNHMHLPAIESLKEYNIFGMYDINKNLRRELSIKYNCKCYLSFDDICNDKNVDLILITTPTRTHYILFKKAAESKKNIIIEKPHATNSLESEEMSKIVKKNNIKTAIVFQRNYSISTEIIKELFSLDDFRKPVIVFGYFWINIAKFFQSDNWRFKKKMGGGAILDLLPHILANLMI